MRTLFDMLRNNYGFAGDPKPKVDEEEVIVGDEQISDDDADDKDVEIDLDEKEEDADAPSNKAFAAMRVENKELKKSVDELKKVVATLQTPEEEIEPVATQVRTGDPNDPRAWTEDQWDTLAKKDWKKAVDLRSKIQAEDRIAASTQTVDFNRVLEDSKQVVLRRHPELNDPNSEKAKIYRNIVIANPEYTQQKKGPLTAMYEMEDYMERNMGYKREEIVKAEKKREIVSF
jgi:hypothetical protein